MLYPSLTNALIIKLSFHRDRDNPYCINGSLNIPAFVMNELQGIMAQQLEMERMLLTDDANQTSKVRLQSQRNG